MQPNLTLNQPSQPTWVRAIRDRLVDHHLLIALAIAMVYHGALMASGTYQRTYDAYVHIFFADHYMRSWFDPWDTRWYTGFTLTSYPPGSQQSIALLAGLLGLRSAFVTVQLCAILWVVVGIYRFSRIWVSQEAAGYAALLTVFASGITETVHVFGQLPTMFSLGFLLNALPYVYRWMRRGELRILLVAWSVNAATTAGHHVSTLFGAVFFVAPVIVLALAEAWRAPLPDEPPGHAAQITRANLRPMAIRRLRRIMPSLVRAGVYSVGLVGALVLVVLPYWLWSRADPITQVSIPHASRDSFIVNTNAGLVFWVIPYGLSILAFPYVYARGFSGRTWPLAGSIALLMLLGTGGTTPIPRMLLRGAFDVLTLDRFTFWATISMLPLLGALVVSIRRGRVAQILRGQLGDGAWYAIQIGLVVAYLAISATVANLTHFRTFQPPVINPEPIATFMSKDRHWQWRYLTLGFGDQLAWVSAQMTAATVDGNYHSARRLPELTTTPVERLEGAKYSGMPGIGSLQQFLAVPDKYNLKFVFSNDQFYDPLLYFSGWHRIQRLENGIMVWEREDVPPLPEVLPRKDIPLWQRAMWGVVPIGAIATSLTLIGLSTLRDIGRGRAHAAPRRWRLPRLWQTIDGRMRAWSRLPHADSSAPLSWEPWRALFARLRAAMPKPAPQRQRTLRSITLAAIGLAAALVAIQQYQISERRPELQVERYFDDLDFRRFERAYQRLDPRTRPSYEMFLLRLSVQGGLVASYGKLDSVHVRIEPLAPDRARAHVQTLWMTALAIYPTTQTLDMVLRDGRWWIVAPGDDPTTPAEAFFRQPTIDWYSQGRRRVRDGPTDYVDILDRPDLQVLSARMVLADGRYRVVGELANIDADPADVTVAGLLYDREGQELTRYNAQTAMMHKIFPKETTPFRVDFEGVAGAVLTDTLRANVFQPGAFTPPELQRPVADFHVAARAVVTGRDLSRALTAQDVRVEQTSAGWVVSGRLFNTGADEATIPHILLTLYDAQYEVAWVEEVIVDGAIRPRRSAPFSIAIRPPASYETLVRGDDRYGAERGLRVAEGAHPSMLMLPPQTGYAGLRISVHAFQGGGS